MIYAHEIVLTKDTVVCACYYCYSLQTNDVKEVIGTIFRPSGRAKLFAKDRVHYMLLDQTMKTILQNCRQCLTPLHRRLCGPEESKSTSNFDCAGPTLCNVLVMRKIRTIMSMQRGCRLNAVASPILVHCDKHVLWLQGTR